VARAILAGLTEIVAKTPILDYRGSLVVIFRMILPNQRSLCPDRRDQRLDGDDIHHAGPILGEHVQRHFGRHMPERFHLEVRRPHPRFDGAERMLDGLAAHLRLVWVVIKTFLHTLKNGLMFPPPDTSF